MRALAGFVGFAAFAASVLVIAPAAASVPDGTPLAPGGSVCPGAVGDPGGVAVLNLTPVAATGAGFGAVRASDAPSNNSLGAQAVSNVNFRPGSVDPNVAFTSIGADRRVCFDNSPHATIHLVADQMGVMPASAYEPAAATGATRLVDTRATGPVAPGASVCPQAVGAPGRIAVVNITPVEATGPGFGAVRSSDAPSNNTLGASAVSNVNFSVGSVDPNLAFAVIGGDGRICFDNSPHSTVQLIVDQMGSVPASAFVPAAANGATRLMDTRIGLVLGGIGVTSVVPGAAVCAKAVGLPGDIAVLNGTPVDATGAGFMAARSSDAPSNNTLGDQAVSNWNFAPGSVDPNVAFAEIGPDGTICVDNSNHATVQVVLDQAGYLPAGQFTPAATTGAARLVDTRRGFVAVPPPTMSNTTTTTTTTTTSTIAPPTAGDSVPEPPSATATAGRMQVTLTWQPSVSDGDLPILEYVVQRSTDGIVWQTIGTVLGFEWLFIDTTPGAAGTAVVYRVAARNSVGYGPPSAVVSAIPFDVPGPVKLLGWEGTYELTTTCVRLSWQAPADVGLPVLGYRIEAFTGALTWATVGTATGTTWNVGCWTGSERMYRVVPYNEAGDGTPSGLTVDPPYRPRPPECGRTVQGEWQLDYVGVLWNPPAGDYDAHPIYAYDTRLLRHSGTQGTEWEHLGSATLGEFARNDSWHIQRGYWYVIQVRAVNALGPGEWCLGTPVWAS